MILWVWLSLCYSSNSTIPKKLIEYFGTPRAAFEASEEECKILTRRPEPLFNKNIDRAMDIVEYVKSNNIGIITYNSPEFPKRLKALDNCPILLYYVGNLYDFDSSPSIGVVGTRNYTPQGERVTKRISYDLARSGFTIVSGLAKGIDSFSHKAALYNKSRTTAILGCGIDVIYPSENRELTLRIYENGLVMTEFAPGTPPAAYNFPARNRIISALSDGLLVTECALKSGTIITADHAFKHNIPVYMCNKLCGDATGYLKARGAFGVTGSDEITSCFNDCYPELKLLKDIPAVELHPEEIIINVKPLPAFTPGTPAFVSAGTVYDALTYNEEAVITAQVYEYVQPSSKKKVPKKDFGNLSEEEKTVIERLKGKCLYIDELADESLSVPLLLRILTSLEIKGFVNAPVGGKYAVNLD